MYRRILAAALPPQNGAEYPPVHEAEGEGAAVTNIIDVVSGSDIPDCRKVPEWLSEFVPIDYVITVYEPADSLTEDGLRVLMHHELLHINVDGEKYRIRAHDLQDFRAITDVYGVNWIETFDRQMRMELNEG